MDLHDVTAAIHGWMGDRGNNAIEPGSALPAFAMPLVGCAQGNDPLFSFLREDIGPDFYWIPEQAFAKAFPGETASADELSVIAWILPQTEHTRVAHRRATEMPSIEWSRGRLFGERVNEALRRFVMAHLARRGIQACAPVLLPQWKRAMSPKYGFASTWSERHTAHVCGLGTFGLSDGLITPAGKAVRVGSVIARTTFTPTPRTYSGHNDWCLFYATGACGICMKRCPAGAITKAGHDKVICKAYIREVTAVHVEQEQLGQRVSSCGLCQVGVPCEARNPTRSMSRTR